jgi:hypothetical protein
MQQRQVVNAFIPLLFAYGELRGAPGCREKALRWLAEMRAEKNTVIAGWMQQGLEVVTAAEGQALLELKKRYCMARRCLECAIGRALLNYVPTALGQAPTV